MALGKEVYSYFDKTQLEKLVPLQNGGKSGENIAGVCRSVVERQPPNTVKAKTRLYPVKESPVYEAMDPSCSIRPTVPAPLGVP